MLSAQHTSSVIQPEISELLRMLTYKRRHGSNGEKKFFSNFVQTLKTHKNATKYIEDDFGNAFVEVCGGSRVAFSAHTDSVHSMPKSGEGDFQEVLYDKELDIIYKADGQPLGADDASGVWMLRRIADAGIPCSLFFFCGEEVGGLGSLWASDNNPDYFKQFDSAVAFDRRGTEDIITHQAGTRCCSDKFAEALADSLNKSGLSYKPCDGGIFTDTANLTHLIPECLNLSCGYFSEHSGDETQDVGHLFALRDAILKVDWAALPIERDPSVVEELPWSGFGYASGGWLTSKKSDGFMSSVDDDYDFRFRKSSPATKYESATSYDINDLYYMTLNEMVEAAAYFPDEFAEVVFRLLNEEE